MAASRRPGGRRYHFFGGKGGVGKTTCAAAVAVGAAAAGRRVLLVSTDPAHSLGDALGTRLSPVVRPVPRAGALEAVELDADRALARFLARRRKTLRLIAERGTYLDEDDIDRLLKLSLPGVDELMGLLELTRLASARAYDDVIVDTAPTGHTLRLLATPETLRRIASVLDDMQAKHRFIAGSLGGDHRRDVADALIEQLDADGRALAALLRDRARVQFSWVLLPERLSLEETADALRSLDAAGIAVTEVVVNRVTPVSTVPCVLCDAKVRAEGAVIDAIERRLSAGRLRLLADHDREPRGLAALRTIARALEGPVAAAPRPAGRGRQSARRSAARPRGDSHWIDVLAPKTIRLLLFGGKGGAGKTTCAAAAAVTLARRGVGQRLLLLSTDPAHSLGDVLGTRLGDEETRIPGGPPNLAARELDADHAWQLRRERYLKGVDEVFGAMLRGSSFEATFDRTVLRELIDLAPPGLDELFGVLSVIEALFRPGDAYETVVVDTAPTGHALRLLELPAAALAWVRALLAIILKYRAVIGLGEFARDLVELSRNLRRFHSLLREPGQTRFVAVTRPAELPRLETIRLLRELDRLHIAAPVVIVNGVRADGCPRCAHLANRERREVGALLAAPAVRERRGVLRAPLVAPPPIGLGPLERWARGMALERPR